MLSCWPVQLNPKEIGWWLIWSLGLYPRSFHTPCMILAVKWVPWSELTLKGSLYLEKMWFINRQAVVSAVLLGAGRHYIHFVNSQTMVRKYFLPRVDRGRGPTQSIIYPVLLAWVFHMFPCALVHHFRCVSIIPLWPWGTTSFDAGEWLRDICENTFS